MSAKRAYDAEPGRPGSMRVYEEVVNFIAAGASSRQVADFRASEDARRRVADLIHREKTTGLSTEETAELENAMQLEHIMRLAKARARLHLES
ncbi:MAG TPA: hypothetical protein VK420_23565 [Longimicrobium sp.]|nr:hypothetical protein [Longimicrobium sp.]